MRTKIIIILALTLLLGELHGQNSLIQSSCDMQLVDNPASVIAFSEEIALSKMWNVNHHYHDSILIPRKYLDSISAFTIAYHNAMILSDSVIDYTNFTLYYSIFTDEVIINLLPSSGCISYSNDSLTIHNDTLRHYIDSLGMKPYIDPFIGSNSIVLSGYGKQLNMFGNFDFFKEISCVKGIDRYYIAFDMPDCYKSRSTYFNGDNLFISFADVNYCNGNSVSKIWRYIVTPECEVGIVDFPTSIESPISNNPTLRSRIYPNPFENELSIESEHGIVEVLFYTLEGSLVKRIKNIESTIKTTDLTNQLYILRLLYNDGLVEYHKLLRR